MLFRVGCLFLVVVLRCGLPSRAQFVATFCRLYSSSSWIWGKDLIVPFAFFWIRTFWYQYFKCGIWRTSLYFSKNHVCYLKLNITFLITHFLDNKVVIFCGCGQSFVESDFHPMLSIYLKFLLYIMMFHAVSLTLFSVIPSILIILDNEKVYHSV